MAHARVKVVEPQAPDEGVADTVEKWMDALIRYVRSGRPDLTNRQMSLMMLVHCREGPHTVRGLAEQLNVSKPVVTRALNKLGTMEFVRRERDAADRRNIFVRRTTKGAEFLDAFAGFVAGGPHDDKSKRGQTVRPAG